MKPLIGTTRFLRPNFAAGVARASFVALRGLSASARCFSTLDESYPQAELDSLDSLDTPDSLQRTSVPEDAKACKEKGTKRGRWTSDEHRRLQDAHAAGMTTKAIEALFPERSPAAGTKLGSALRNDDDYPNENTTTDVFWSPAEKELLRRLHGEGASIYKLRAHFPTRTQKSLEGAISRWVTQVLPSNSKRGGAPWSGEDLRWLAELAAQGVKIRAIAEALGRTCNAVSHKACDIGIKLSSIRKKFTAEDVEVILRMRGDGASYQSIYTALGRAFALGSIQHMYYRNRPRDNRDEDSDAKLQNILRLAQLSLDDLKTIDSLRAQGATWSAIERQYSGHEPGLIHEGYRRYAKGSLLSATDLRKVGSLRQEGHTWQRIANSNEFKHYSADGIRYAYRRANEKQQPARPTEQ